MFENILYATDFSESPFMLPCIGIIGKTKKIHLLHVVDEQNRIDPALFEPRMQEARDFLDEELNIERNKGVSTDVHLLPGPGRDICGIAEDLDASLIVVNYHKPAAGGQRHHGAHTQLPAGPAGHDHALFQRGGPVEDGHGGILREPLRPRALPRHGRPRGQAEGAALP